jgi:siroheme synthase (precorrin-2 oxidase/ferrochelatase)
MLRALALTLIAVSTVGAAPRTANLMRDAITPATALAADKVTTLTGESDDEKVIADITLAANGGAITKIAVSQDGKALRLPETAYAAVAGAKIAWLEERGALTTLVIEGVTANKDWRLALEFHPKQIWLRRLSREGVAEDNFTYYDRDDLKKTRVFDRHAGNHGFHPSRRSFR